MDSSPWLRTAAFATLVALIWWPAARPASAGYEPGCVGLAAPVPGGVLAGFSPLGQYAGHWGVDLAARPGDVVKAAGGGTVSFSGIVAGNRTVTVDHGGGLKTSYSYLSSQLVGAGQAVSRGQSLGTAGAAHGESGLHFSVRIAGAYVDPIPRLDCRPLDLRPALRLIPD